MDQILGAFAGAMTAVMNTCNAGLSALWGNYTSNVFIHIVGLCCILPFSVRHLRWTRGIPWWCYLGGVIGVLTVLFSNLSINTFGVTATLVFALLGQTAFSLAIDQFGWFGSEQNKADRGKWLSLLCIAVGAGVMLL